ncbi:unnamed protein product, partial [marine sediment metagenome]
MPFPNITICNFGAGPIILIGDQNVELTTGFTSFESYIDGKNYEHSKEMEQILEITGMRPISGAGPIILIGDQNVELTTGFTSFES